MSGRRAIRWVGAIPGVVSLSLALAACGGPILAEPVPTSPTIVRPTVMPSRPADPRPVELPRDDGPHDRLTEWWYDTGHLVADDGRHFGFEMVVFRAERGEVPVAWASHLAVTDEHGQRFLYDQRAEIGPQVDRSMPGTGFDLAIQGDLAPGIVDPTATPWTMRGAGSTAMLSGSGTAGDGTPFGLSLELDAAGRPATLHDGDGYVDFGPAGGSYYYSRPGMTARGTITLGDQTLPVTGTAWFDHQWGDFIAVGGGGWDWFAVELADGTDLMLSLVRDASGNTPLVYGTIVAPDGTSRHLDRDAFVVEVTGHWVSPDTAARYPAGWHIDVPSEGLRIDLTPSVADQELDTRATTGVVYWEGSQVVQATRHGVAVPGDAYVELTGYLDAR